MALPLPVQIKAAGAVVPVPLREHRHRLLVQAAEQDCSGSSQARRTPEVAVDTAPWLEDQVARVGVEQEQLGFRLLAPTVPPIREVVEAQVVAVFSAAQAGPAS